MMSSAPLAPWDVIAWMTMWQGSGVGLALGVGLGLGLADQVGDQVGVAVGVAVWVAVGVQVGVELGVAVGVGGCSCNSIAAMAMLAEAVAVEPMVALPAVGTSIQLPWLVTGLLGPLLTVLESV
jgi:hypothetical protein